MTPFVYDVIIFSFLLIDGIAIAAMLRQKKQKWPDFLHKSKNVWHAGRILLFLIFAASWLVIFYGSFIEPRIIVTTRQTINLSENPTSSLKAAFISDFHAGPYKKSSFVEKAVSKINALKPDVILLGGDFVHDSADQTKYLIPLKNLQAPLGVFAIIGNHEYSEEHGIIGEISEKRAVTVRQTLENAGIKVFVNEGIKIKKDNKNIYLLGIDDLWTYRASIDAAKLQSPNILLGHNPDSVFLAEKLGVDLVLSGHTHGGQIRLPFLGAVPPIPDELGQKYDMGLFEFEKTQLFISSGIGEYGPRARLFVPPEIALLNITF